MTPLSTRVLLTGAGGGIGQATARMLVNAGASVLLAGRSPARLAAQARELLRETTAAVPGQVEWYAADLMRPASIGGLAAMASDWGCNVVIHNAGVPGFGRLESFTAEDMTEVMHLNLVVPMLLTQGLLPGLRDRPIASIVFVGSVLGRLGLPGYSVYSASKFGLRGFAESLRRELGDTRIKVQYLGPRSTRTSFNTEAAAHYNRATGTATDAPELAARALLDLLASGAPERFLGFPEKLAVRLNGLAPAWLDSAFAKHRAALPPLSIPPARLHSPSTLPMDADTHSLMHNTP